MRLCKDKLYLRGTPSPLTRYFGNFHKSMVYFFYSTKNLYFPIEVRLLRQALYSKLEIKDGICEEFPDWNEKDQKVYWVKDIVLADPAMVHLLQVFIFI